MIILGLDGLDYSCVRNFNCRNLMQYSYGYTDLSEFGEMKTVVLWSSFLAEMNMEKEIQDTGVLWDFKLPAERTFFARFRNWRTLDVPGFSYDDAMHQQEREKLKNFFDKKGSIEEYDQVVFRNHQKSKEKFLRMLEEDCDIQMGYFALADAIGHLSFGVSSKMRIVYQELDDLVSEAAKKDNNGLLILSDHGMETVGRFGDHSRQGFWSSSLNIAENNLKLTHLFKTFMGPIHKVNAEKIA